ncbi:phosphatase PAP2 family protein [Cellulomonas sp. HZM]|uniref:phosphatase PAP2 family protein n=1 Tax=Cellulomonas sp. HZM TaxID=1454010 RepID=UPI000689A2DE|nr:phosphatase PAP2 family protein [Cellulomonas sp. HZM]
MTSRPVSQGEATGAKRARHVLIAREAAIMVAIYVVYSIIRNHAPNRTALAFHHSREILRVETWLGVDAEHAINHWAASFLPGITVANYMYATLFLPSAIFVLGWMWFRTPGIYHAHRTVLVVMTTMALAIYWAFPAAPPRLLPGAGYIDTVEVFGIWGKAPGEGGHGVSNQFAAMPSMHFGWALWCGVAFFRATVVRWQRVIAVLFPTATLFVIIATGNHFLLDAAAGAAVFGVSWALVVVVQRMFAPTRVEEPVDLAAAA